MAFEVIDFISPVGKFLLLTMEVLFLNHINIWFSNFPKRLFYKLVMYLNHKINTNNISNASYKIQNARNWYIVMKLDIDNQFFQFNNQNLCHERQWNFHDEMTDCGSKELYQNWTNCERLKWNSMKSDKLWIKKHLLYVKVRL
jgi:hypothetical protein